MNEAVIREKLIEICEEMTVSPEPENTPTDASKGVYVSEHGTTLEGAIDQLRIHVKYLMFDLEASCRENRYLRQMLESRPPYGRDKKGENNGPSHS